MTINVTMKQTRRGADGSPLVGGQSYDLADSFACYLIGANLATDTNGALVGTAPYSGDVELTDGVLHVVSGLITGFTPAE
jgi:hypothetical protein